MAKYPTKAQHYIPRSYLAAWVDPATPADHAPYLWRFSKDGGEGYKKSPKKTFVENDFYTVQMPTGEKNLEFEKLLGRFETGIVDIRRDFLERRRHLPTTRHVKLMAFLSAMHSRTKAFRDFQRQQWGDVLKIGEEMSAQLEGKSSEELSRIAQRALPSSGPTISMDDVKKLHQFPIHHFLPAAMKFEVPIYCQMNSVVLCTQSEPGFITSDAPVAIFDPMTANNSLYGPRLMSPAVEISMPISPRQLLLLRHSNPPIDGFQPFTYWDVPESLVTKLNHRHRAYAANEIIVQKNYFDQRWL